MNNAELASRIKAVEDGAKALSGAINGLVDGFAEGPVANHAFAAQFHLQDCLNRVSNISVFLAQKTDESLESAVDKATNAGNLRIV